MTEALQIAPVKASEVLTSHANVLLVDDRDDGLLALEAVLAGENYHLVKARSGPEALQCLKENDFAVILLDVQMPVMDGFETARLVRKNPRYKETPIIFVTAISTDSHRVYKGYESGAVDFLFKPFDSFILKSKVDVFVDLFRKNQQIKHQSHILHELELRDKERQLAEMELESLRRYVHLADAIPHMVLKMRQDGVAEYCNQMWYQYTGLDIPSKDKDWQLALHPFDRKKLVACWERCNKARNHNFRMEGRIRFQKNGSYRWHLICVVAEEKNNQITGWITTCMDIHELKVFEEKLKVSASDLDRSNKDLEQFAYAASHDLKEPLHVVAGYAQLLRRRYKSKLDNEADEFIGYMLSGINRMQALIGDLLNYSLIGNDENFFTQIDCQVCYENAIANLQLSIKETNATVTSEKLPVIWGNETQITQLFQNLISNAIKFRGPNNQPVIQISIDTKGPEWVFSVKDNGIGIKVEYFNKIFEIFRRLHSDVEYHGTGIGLATCKKIIERHGGKIWLESELGKGSVFYFKIPKNRQVRGLSNNVSSTADRRQSGSGTSDGRGI